MARTSVKPTPQKQMVQVQYRPLSALKKHPKNPRTIKDTSFKKLVTSIRENPDYFEARPIILSDRTGELIIIAGNQRFEAARDIGIKDVPTALLPELTEEKEREIMIRDNIANGDWDWDMLANEWDAAELGEWGLDVPGWEDGGGAGNAGQTDPDDVPEPEEAAVSVLGDLWILGGHRLLCGDSTDAVSIEKLFQGRLFDVCFTSPPYAQQRQYHGIDSDWDRLMSGVFSLLKHNTAAQVFVNLGLVHKDGEWLNYWDQWLEFMRSSGWRRFGLYIWDQGAGMPGDWAGRLAPSFEMIFHFNQQPIKPQKTESCKYAGDIKQGGGQRGSDGKVKEYTSVGKPIQDTKIGDSIIRIPRQQAQVKGVDHPAMYPVALPEHFFKCWPGKIAFEPFSGSGSTMLAAENCGMACYAMELSPIYTDVAIRRWQNFTGNQAILEATGQTFEEVKNGRAS